MKLRNNNDNYCSYYKLVNRAEMFIVHQNYSEALNLYQKAFKINEGFSNDSYNALLCAVELKNIDLVYFNARVLAEKGLCIDFFEQFQILKNNTKYWNKIVEIVDSKGKINIDYRIELERMLSNDQNIRPLRMDNSEAVKQVDSLNFMKFKKLVIQYGYPSERLIGIKCSENRKGIAPQPQRILLRHFYQNKYFSLDTFLLQSMKNLLIKPEEYATYSYFINAPNTRCDVDPITLIDKKYYVFTLTDSIKNAIDNNRNSICLFSREEHIEKIKFKETNNSKGFRIPQYSSINSLSNLPKDIKESLMKDLHVIKF